MARRLTYEEKGKGLQSKPEAPRTGRLRVPEFDNTELIRKHELTLIGRTTNPKIQRIWSLIPFLSDLWKTKTRPVGSDLGQGLFQFQFASQEDMQMVHANRPYHFARWMIILQKWEPSIDPSFPSVIPFWIKVQGVPLHLWNEAILRGIGEDLGAYESCEILPGTIKLRTHINGLLPLIKEYTLELARGEEITATLVYEKLEKHCENCLLLSHEKEDCPAIRREREERDKIEKAGKEFSAKSGQIRRNDLARYDRKNEEPRRTFQGSSGALPQRSLSVMGKDREDDRRRPDRTSAGRYGSRFSSGRTEDSNYQLRNYPRDNRREGRWIETGRRFQHSSHSKERELSREEDRGSSYRSACRRTSRDDERSLVDAPRGRDLEGPLGPLRTGVERVGPSEPSGPSTGKIPEEVMKEARDELRDAMIQYTSCADPTESAARIERLKRAEELGEADETTEQIARRIMKDQLPPPMSATTEAVPARIPAVQRLGPAAPITEDDIGTEERGRIPAKKRLGRPPTAKALGVNITAVGSSAISKPRKTVAQKRDSPKRRTSSRLSKPTKKAEQLIAQRRKERLECLEPGTSNPPIKLIPAATKKRKDFHNPLPPIP